MCILLMGVFLAGPLWRRGLTTLGDLFRQRYGRGVEWLAVVLMVPTSVIWAAAQIRAFGQVLAASSTLGVDLAISIAAGVVIVYTALGGLLADAISDFIQGLVLILGLVVLAAAMYLAVPEGASLGALIDPARLHFRAEGESWLAVVEAWSIPILGSLFAQELIARILATRSPQLARRASLAATGLYVCVGMIPVCMGLIGPAFVASLDDPEHLLPTLAQQHLPVWLYVIFAGAIISAILSTVDSTLLAAGALTSHNLVLPLLRGPSEARKLRISRSCVVGYGVLAWFLAIRAEGVYALVEEASAFGSAGIFVTALCALFVPWGGAASAAASLVFGVAAYVCGAHVFGIDYPYLASLGAALLGYAVFLPLRVRPGTAMRD
jgi:Na+/proline symporter